MPFTTRDLLLFLLVSVYVVPIAFVALSPPEKSVSHIICDKSRNAFITICMMLMGIVAICYEIDRKDAMSVLLISFLLISIYGLLGSKETMIKHYMWAFAAFVSIFAFMTYHSFQRKHSTLLMTILATQCIVFLQVAEKLACKKDIFVHEIIYIVNFAIFYLCLHTLS